MLGLRIGKVYHRVEYVRFLSPIFSVDGQMMEDVRFGPEKHCQNSQVHGYINCASSLTMQLLSHYIMSSKSDSGVMC